MLHDARRIPRDTALAADVCIVGAGAAGIALARELAGGALRVALLESGGLEADSGTQALARGLVHGRSYFRLHEARTRRFGGSTNCWHGLCRPLDPSDFEARDWVPESGWPFGFEVLRPHYERAQALCRLGPFDYGAERFREGARTPLPFASGTFESRVLQVAPTRFGEVYRDELLRAPNVDVHLFANAVALETDADARRVEALRVATLDGNAFRVRAKRFVLAAGGIENARLLLLPTAARPAGIGNEHDLVGRYFMEHPHLISGALLPSSAALSLEFYRARGRALPQIFGCFAPSEETLRRERILASTLLFADGAALPPFEQDLAGAIFRMDERGETGGQGAGPAETVVLLLNQCEQAPNRESRVRLASERDALGLPRAQLEWRLSGIDQHSIRRAQELLARELGRAGLARLRIELSAVDHEWPSGLLGGRHHMGTTRMHADPRRGVVDADGRVHGVANLYVAGSSVFPTGGAANPTLTLLALALRLADHLKATPA